MNIQNEFRKSAPARSGNVKSGSATSGAVVDRINDAIRDNPLAAGLIGAGVVWMLFGAKGIGAAAGFAKGAADKAASATVGAGEAIGSGVRTAANAMTSSARDAGTTIVDQAASIVPDISMPDVGHAVDVARDAARDATTAVGEGLQSVASAGREYGAVLQSRLSETLDKQPLLLGAIGLAIGAGIASTFASTDVEREWMGERGAAARDQLQKAADTTMQHGRAVLSDMQDEATRQGLTMDAAKDASSTVAGKVKTIADTAREAVAQPLKVVNN